MKKDIRLCLVYRDMWQSAGKYVPRVDQLVQVAGPIIDMGCFARVETNGGGFEQITLLYGENPNRAVRQWTQPFNDVGIQTQMLERGLNGIRMYPVPRDVRALMFRVKKRQGTDISRSFDGLNDVRNIRDSIILAQAGGMIAQATLSIAHSPIHTVDYYVNMAHELIEAGADEICIKDMAGVGRPASLGEIVRRIKADYPDMLVQYHGHAGPGFSAATSLEVARAGADIIDVGMEPLSWGTGHADLLTVHAMLRDAGFAVPDIDMKAYMHARSLTQGFIDEWLGYYIDPRNRQMNSLLIGPGLPGGMMGSLMADLEGNLGSLNKWLEKNNQPTLSQDDLLIRLFDEVETIWPMMGYPPLVTPYSQYVKNVALMNVMQMTKGKPRWSMIDDNTWDMLLGRQGSLPGPLAPELLALAEAQGRSFYTGHPQELYPDNLETFRAEMQQQGWDPGEDEEELMELAMHPQQYRAYKSGKAKAEFEADLAKRRAPVAPVPVAAAVPATPSAPALSAALLQTLHIDVNGETFRVTVAYGANGSQPVAPAPQVQQTPPPAALPQSAHEILSPLEGVFYLTKDPADKPLKPGDRVEAGMVVCYIESMKVLNAVTSPHSGTLAEIVAQPATAVEEDAVLLRIS
ncbi:MAG: pyruvate carboxylase subunit B [Bacteroidia bacterium]